MRYFFSTLILFLSCTPLPEDVLGCKNSSACNFNADANEDDGSCMYPDGTDGGSIQQSPGDTNYNCDGICIVDIDCAGTCGGNAAEDECGACDSTKQNDCIQDCNGDWGGGAYINDCKVCVSGET